MRFRAVLLAVAALALVPAAGAQGATSKAKRCTAKGAKTVVKDRYARVFTVDGPGSQGEDVHRRLYGCLYSTGRRVLLAVAYDDELYAAGSFSQVTLNGRFVAWQYVAFDSSCKADCPPEYDGVHQTINVADLRTREEGNEAGAAREGTLAVSRRGTATWLDAVTGEPGRATLR